MAVDQYRVYKTDLDKVKVYEHRIRQAEDDMGRWENIAKRAIKRYENQHTANQQTPTGHIINVPDGIAIIDALFSSLTATEIDIAVTPLGSGTEDQAYVATAALNKEWGLCKVEERVEEAVKDSLLVGIGWVKVGYEYFEQDLEVPRPDEAVYADLQALLTEAGYQYDPEVGDLVATDKNAPEVEDIVGQVPITETKKVAIKDRVVVDYVPWDDVLVDPTAKRIQDIHWIAQKTLFGPEEVKNNPLYREYAKRSRNGLKQLQELKADTQVSRDIIGDGTPQPEDARVTVYEVWDFETGTVSTFAKGAKFLLNETPNPFAFNVDAEDRNPFVPLVLRTSNRRIRGISDMEVLLPTLDEMDLYHSRLATHLERMSPKILGPARAFTEAGKEAIKSQEYGAFVELADGVNPNEVTPFNPPPLVSEVYGVSDKLQVNARDATGVNELMQGLFPDRKRTATETANVVQMSAARQSEKRNHLERFYRAIATRMLQLMQAYYDQDRVVRLVDDAGSVQWAWNAEDITLEAQLEISLTPKEEKTWQVRQDRALSVLNVLGPLAQPDANGQSLVDKEGLVKWVLAEMGFSRRTIADLLNLPEEQQAQAMAAQQMQAAQASAAAGQPRPDMVPGPLTPEALAAATNQGNIPPEVMAAAMGNTPVSGPAVEQVSESAGVKHFLGPAKQF